MSVIDTLITDRGPSTFYNSTDLNRVGQAMDWLADKLFELGYQIIVTPNVSWARTSIPVASQMAHYLDDLRKIRETLTQPSSTPEVPSTMNGLTYSKANDIETILSVTNALIEWMVSVFFYTGDLFAGEV